LKSPNYFQKRLAIPTDLWYNYYSKKKEALPLMVEKGKEKKVTARETLRTVIAGLLMDEFGLEKIGRTKEGLLVRTGDEDLIVRVILKKNKVEAKDIVETIARKDAAVVEEEVEVEEDGEEEDAG